MDFILKNIWFILFVIWGLPLSYYRSKFRKMVYQTDSWIINIKPVFFKEIKGLFGNIYPDNLEYKKFRIPKGIAAFLTLVILWIVFISFVRFIIPLLISELNTLSNIDFAAVLDSIEDPIVQFL